MKSLVSSLSTLVRRSPWLVIIVAVVVSMVLGVVGAGFTPEEDSNASFAPEAAELTAAEDMATCSAPSQQLLSCRSSSRPTAGTFSASMA